MTGDKTLIGDAVRVMWTGAGVGVALERGRQVTSERCLAKQKEIAMSKDGGTASQCTGPGVEMRHI